MTFSNYKYNLSNGNTYSYTKTTYTSTGSAGSAGSGSCSGIKTSQTVVVGSLGSASSSGSIARIGSVGNLDFYTIIDKFTTGNLTSDETVAGLRAKGAQVSTNLVKNGNRVITFKYQNKNYTITCNSNAASSQVDNVTVCTYARTQLNGIPANEISKYFDIVSQNGTESQNKYVLKQGCGYTNIDTLKNTLFNQYKKQPLLRNIVII